MNSQIKANDSAAQSVHYRSQPNPRSIRSLYTLLTSETWLPRLLLLGGIVAIFLRAPELVLRPRFWAEEATCYFKYAYLESFWRAALMIPMGEGGYYSLSANLPSLLASRLLPIEQAPTLTTTFAFLVHLTPIFLIGYGSSLLWDTPLKKILAVGVYLFAPMHPEEAWMNSINSMSYLGMVSLVILAENTAKLSKMMFSLQLGALFFNGLSAVYTNFLAPAFLVKWLLFRTRRNFSQLAVVVAASAIQTSVVIAIALSGGMPEKKFGESVHAVRVATGIIEQIVLKSFIGPHEAYEWAKRFGLRELYDKPTIATGTELFVWIPLLAIPSVLLLLSRHPLRWVLLTAFIFESVLASVGALGGGAESRYAMVPQFTLFLLLLSILWSQRSTWPGRIVQLVVLTAIPYSFYAAALDRRTFSQFEYHQGAPVWAKQVARWKADPNYPIKIWPYPDWTVYLPTASGTDSLRAFADAIEAKAAAAQGDTTDSESITFEAQLTEVPLDGRVKVHLAADLCERVAEVRLIFSRAGEKRSAQTSTNGRCEPVTVLVKGPLLRGDLIKGQLEVIARPGMTLQRRTVAKVAAFPAKETLFW